MRKTCRDRGRLTNDFPAELSGEQLYFDYVNGVAASLQFPSHSHILILESL